MDLEMVDDNGFRSSW